MSWDLSGILQSATNIYNGINAGQPSTTPSGSVSVPTTQAGNGIVSSLINAGASILQASIKNTGVAPQVQTSQMANAGGSQAVAQLPGGIIITLPGTQNPPVPEQGGGWKDSAQSVPVWVWIVGGVLVVFVLFGKQVKKLFK